MEGLEYEYAGETSNSNSKWTTTTKVFFVLLIFIILLLIAASVFFFLKTEDKDDDNNENFLKNEIIYIENGTYLDFDGIKYSNISYSNNGIILNTFKKDGENYKEELGNINKGNDYKQSQYNYYNLYIPFTNQERKKGYNQIFLFIHGGAWTSGYKEKMEFFCQTYTQLGYITVTMDYTLVNNSDYESNAFRMIDEISTVIKNVKERLKKEGFNENKLELAIGGSSAGGHLTLLYAYSIKNPAIPIKFIINLSGPTTLELKYFTKIKNEETLENIQPNDIKEAKKQNKTEGLGETMDRFSLSLMNLLTEKKYSENELIPIINQTDGKVNEENEIYQNIIKLMKFAIPVNYVDENSLPTLCIYGGKDTVVGIEMYSLLKEKFDEKKNKKIELVYSRNWKHSTEIFKNNDGIYETQQIHYKILEFAQKYFKSNPNLIFM